MPFAENLKRPLWIASGFIENGVRQYGTPVLHRWNWRVLSTLRTLNPETLAAGPEYRDDRRAMTSNTEVEGLKRFDRVWMDVAPGEFDSLAADADFEIVGLAPGIGVTEVSFKRLGSDASENPVS
jgi:hypothetical protein